MVEIHIAQAKKWKFYRDLRLRALGDSPNAFTSSLERENQFTKDEWVSRIENGASFVASDNNRGIGMIQAIQTSESQINEYYLVAMWVDPNYRGTNLATQLVDSVRNWAKSKKVTGLYLHVESTNQAAIRLYEKVGFIQVPNTRLNPKDSKYEYLEMVCKI